MTCYVEMLSTKMTLKSNDKGKSIHGGIIGDVIMHEDAKVHQYLRRNMPRVNKYRAGSLATFLHMKGIVMKVN